MHRATENNNFDYGKKKKNAGKQQCHFILKSNIHYQGKCLHFRNLSFWIFKNQSRLTLMPVRARAQKRKKKKKKSSSAVVVSHLCN